jgi:hypothetical protein
MPGLRHVMRKAFTLFVVAAQVFALSWVLFDQQPACARAAFWHTGRTSRAPSATQPRQVRSRMACAEPTQTAARPRTAVSRASLVPARRAARLRAAAPAGAEGRRPLPPLILRI